MNVIEVKNLYKIFGDRPERAFPLLDQGKSKEEILDKTGCTIGIDNASFSVKQKEVFVIMGLSGSGKSTVIRCLNRLIEPTRGEVLINGTDILKMSNEELLETRRKKMSMVFQHFALLPHMTVLQNAGYGLEISGVEQRERDKKAMNALEQVGLKGYEHQYPSELSGGMQQRVGLARALANDPEILLMDEAFSALDPLIRSQMQDELLELQTRMHKTIVFITHDLDEALKLGDRIIIMKAGAIVQIGTPEEILTRPADDYVKAFVQNVDKTKVIPASSIMRKPVTVTLGKEGPKVAIRRMEKAGVSTIYVLDSERRFKGIVRIDDAVKLAREDKDDLTPAVFDGVYTTTPDTSIGNLLRVAIETKYPLAVQNENGNLLGIIDRASVIAEVNDNFDDEDMPVLLKQFEENQPDEQKEG